MSTMMVERAVWREQGRSLGDVVTKICAFCRGEGRDPFSILSSRARCAVCTGGGAVQLRAPVVRCAFCQGSGVYPRTRLTCALCAGTGWRHVSKITPLQTCPSCHGSGETTTGSHLPCLSCQGKGIIEQKETTL